MPASFATAQDLANLLQRDVDTAYAELLLGNASRIVRAAYPWIDARIAAGTFDAELARQVVTAMVKRAMLGPQGGEKAGSVGEVSVSYDNALQNLWLSTIERGLIEGPARPAVGSMKLRAGWTVPSGEWL